MRHGVPVTVFKAGAAPFEESLSRGAAEFG